MKFTLMLRSLFVGGLLLSGCNANEEEAKALQSTENEDQAEDVQAAEGPGNTESAQSFDFIISEYSSFKAFVRSINDDLTEGSEYRQTHTYTEADLAYPVRVYSKYFAYEIEEMGLQQEFEELNELGVLAEQSIDTTEYDQHAKDFKEKVHQIAAKVENGDDVSGAVHRLGKWASARYEWLSKPLKDAELQKAKNDEGLEYFLKAREISADIPKQAATENEELAEMISKIMNLSTQIFQEQAARADHLPPGSNGPEDVEYADQWKPVSENMRETFKELKQVIGDLAETLTNR
ncbi:hypothetical protein [Sporosarcina sp.]|uniref:hypothetical protein n=1 Tax=Sporosarcina sp. TaxID=49982 RepID=UPI002610252F|nr:hypothetical protein [Sporosarcina sp.]